MIYISSNPVPETLSDRFYKTIPIWKYEWNNVYKTVLPHSVYYYTLKVYKKYPDKRFIIHFLQPHLPFVDGFCKGLDAIQIYSLLRQGKISKDDFLKAYMNNIREALVYVEKLVEILDGKIVITSDHGEAFGEPLHKLIPYKVYGHPPYIRIKPLIEVPWFETQGKGKNKEN